MKVAKNLRKYISYTCIKKERETATCNKVVKPEYYEVYYIYYLRWMDI